MSDRYQSFSASPIGKILVKNLGLPSPVKLDRWKDGAPFVDGVAVVGGAGRLGDAIAKALTALNVSSVSDIVEGEKYKVLIFDATGIKSSAELVELQQFFTPKMRSLKNCARVVVLGTNPAQTDAGEERVAQRALEGFTRSLGKEIG
ncbi:MAG TPA: short chain dehydrogenase, partial [Marmoricola sp.]|nr:short chain dehydrogenase [Marmoricola sp.]